MIQRRLLEQARVREERVRRQAYKDALDVKVFEEELEASRWRKGGANPNLSTRTEDGVVVTDFNFFSNQQPLRFAATGKFAFVPVHVGTIFAPKIRAMTCPKRHALNEYSRSYTNCNLCRTRGTQCYCPQSRCNFQVCTRMSVRMCVCLHARVCAWTLVCLWMLLV